MIALLNREFVNLPLLCGVAGLSLVASSPLTRGAFGFSLSTSILPPSHWDCLGSASICICPLSFFLSPAGSAPSVPDCVILPAALLLSFSTYVVDTPGPSVRASRCYVPLPHCVFPEASARTRWRLIASSRNPATFSMSSSFMKA